MTVSILTGGTIGTNSYVIYQEDSKAAVVIDPSDDASLVRTKIKALSLRVQAILLTHAHFDHGGDAEQIRKLTGAPVYLHPADRDMPSWLTHGLKADRDLAEGQELDFEGLRLKVLHTPGHSPGSVCFLCEDKLFAGDTLFAGSCGRTDLWGGSWPEMLRSLRRLAALEGDYVLYPGHGEESTLGEERRWNPYMAQALEAEL